MYAFDIERPSTVADAVKLLSDSVESQPLGGGQTLIPTLKQRLASPERLVSLGGIDEIRGICQDDAGRICIGGATTHAEVAAGAGAFPALAGLAGNIGDPAVRNRGTIGGSLANNDPSACYPAAVLGAGATVVTNTREIAADDYFQGMFTTALDEGEIITEVKFPVPERAAYMKFEQPASRFALVGVFVAKTADGVRVAVTGASEEGVFRWAEAEAALNGDFSASALEGMSPGADGMISDLHGSSEYRAHLVGVMTRRAVAAA
ncbi:xanthine dehydrogenase family protein subunit M [Roseovarius faecimaris]|uniref:Xanthine dehydrogenase family protein subunit M n=1 Tax=Roseovarius faecimaris TaxID=2494550 RepID=A0A6I6IQF5_9RHOB|nr:xanthine dehydrogenase family protein subunit M [Roseovarius faecimaris]QGX98073.1 xanthine dehydrogenase family protein subunit M [Roseovarius faecimaris]